MRQEPLKLVRLEQALPIDYINRAQKMRELMQSPAKQRFREYEPIIWWVSLGILVTAILLVLWGGK